MKIISSREFRANQKLYLDLADQDEQIIVQRGKDKAYLLTPIGDSDLLAVNEELTEKIYKAEKAIKDGDSVTISDPNNIWESIL